MTTYSFCSVRIGAEELFRKFNTNTLLNVI